MRPAVIGVDPGLSGAFACFVDGQIVVEDMPVMTMRDGKRRVDTKAVAALLRDWCSAYSPVRAVVEDVHAMPKQGVVSVFSFGYSAGSAQQALASALIPVTLVQPAVWKAMYGLRGGRENKGASRHKAAGLFPGQAALFARVKDDGRAEAALLAHYGNKLS